MISGIVKLLDEMLCNLCDNAVKCNKPGGSVSVEVCKENGNAVVLSAIRGSAFW